MTRQSNWFCYYPLFDLFCISKRFLLRRIGGCSESTLFARQNFSGYWHVSTNIRQVQTWILSYSRDTDWPEVSCRLTFNRMYIYTRRKSMYTNWYWRSFLDPLVHRNIFQVKWVSTWEIALSDLYARGKLKSACASAQSNQSFHCPREKTLSPCITKTRLFKYIENITSKNWNFSEKNSDIFHISAQNIDCGYSLEPPRRGGSNEYPQSMFLKRNKKNKVYPFQPQFYYIKVGFKGVNII